jgi:20S proteasome alpha/beta subunit
MGKQNDQWAVAAMGETERVATRAPRQALVRDISKDEAVEAATNIINAASAALPTHIGGPVDVLFIGSEPRPQRIRWKNR